MFQSILYEDDSIIVVNKNPGIAVISGRAINENEILSKYLEVITGGKIFIVHRLDRETSGVIIFAKNSETHRYLSMQFEKRKTKKEYLAVVSGKICNSGKIDEPIFEFGSGRMGIDTRGKLSLTEYNVQKCFHNASILEVFPYTGRRHQIRVHLYSIGHPVLGDTLYGYPRPVGGMPRLMLHAHRLSINLENGTEKTFLAPTHMQWNEIVSNLADKE